MEIGIRDLNGLDLRKWPFHISFRLLKNLIEVRLLVMDEPNLFDGSLMPIIDPRIDVREGGQIRKHPV
jgi:hypothetical protein